MTLHLLSHSREQVGARIENLPEAMPQVQGNLYRKVRVLRRLPAGKETKRTETKNRNA
jgi:hypothetical protein